MSSHVCRILVVIFLFLISEVGPADHRSWPPGGRQAQHGDGGPAGPRAPSGLPLPRRDVALRPRENSGESGSRQGRW